MSDKQHVVCPHCGRAFDAIKDADPRCLAVGDTVRIPDGRIIRITGGRFWGDCGLSNFWYWREVLPDGSLSDKEEHGYGNW